MLDRTFSRTGLAAIVVAATFATWTSSPARADYPDYVRSACKADFKKYCPSYKVGSSELRSCMRAVANELSSRCIDALERNGEKRKK